MAPEMSYLKTELEIADSVTEVDVPTTSGLALKFSTESGEYLNLSSEVITILGRYDVSLTCVSDDGYHDFYIEVNTSGV